MQDLTHHPDALKASAPPPSGGWLRQNLPSLLVFLCLGGLLVWGHSTGWKLPSFASLLGKAPKEGADWCPEHSVPESECVECNPDLMPKSKSFGWCTVHGVHECPLEHPEVAQTTAPATVTGEDFARARRALTLAPRQKNNSKCTAHERRIQFASEAAAERAGIKVDEVRRGPIAEFVSANGEITYDQTRTARLSARVPGTVFRALKNVGEAVQKDEVIALVDAAEVGRAKAEFLHAIAQFRLKSRTQAALEASSGSIPAQALRAGETALNEARIRLATARQALINLGLPVNADALEKVPDDKLADTLRFLGIPAPMAGTFDPNATTGNLLAITAPFAGIVVNRDVVAGEVVDVNRVLFVVADIRQMWLTLEVRLEDAASLRLGQHVRFRPDSDSREAEGEVSWISTEADRKTRTVKVRAILDNKNGDLRSNTFGTGKIILREEKEAIVVPNESVHWEGDCSVVFVRDKNYLAPGTPKVFHTRTVRLGVKEGNQTEIIAGVLPGETVATAGSALLRAELLRANLGES
jgi:cobalt-zinc-cadmium efflux system membrane fusion protein